MSTKFQIIFGVAVGLSIGAAVVITTLVKHDIIGPLPALLPASQDKNSTPNTSGINLNDGETPGPLKIAPGFGLAIFADKLGVPRDLALDPKGVLVVSIPNSGKVVAMPDNNQDGAADEGIDVVTGLNKPHGILFYEDKLYIAETDAVAIYNYNPDTKKASNRKKIIDLPGGSTHSSRSIHLDESVTPPKLLVSTGSSCNVCFEEDERRAAVWTANLDGSEFKPFATGLRNSVFFATNPVTGDVWATEMGRDNLGDDTPPDEINILTGSSANPTPNFGWPICYGKKIHDTNFDKNTYIQDPCNQTIASHIDLQAHSAPLGLAFIPEEGWPEEYWHDLLVSYHGSWNRSTPTGYKIVRWKLGEDFKPEGQEDFIYTFLGTSAAQSYGRPADILLTPGGTGYISDDKAGRIYLLRVTNDSEL